MSADMMVICREDNSNYEGNTDLAFFVDETSMGEPWSEFGKWFQARFCGAPGLLETIYGMKSHNYTEVKGADVAAIQEAVEKMEVHSRLSKTEFIEYMKSHVGKHISTENW